MSEYAEAKSTLGWTHERLAQALGAGLRCCYRYSSGEDEIPPDRSRLLRLLVLLKLTLNERKFEQIVSQLH